MEPTDVGFTFCAVWDLSFLRVWSGPGTPTASLSLLNGWLSVGMWVQ